jgi:hypothetical protein
VALGSLSSSRRRRKFRPAKQVSCSETHPAHLADFGRMGFFMRASGMTRSVVTGAATGKRKRTGN